MGAHRRRAGGGLEFYDRAEKKNFAAHAISAKLLRIRLTCLLRVRGNAKRQCDPKCECACLTSYRSFHIPFPAARVPLGTFPRCGHEAKKQLRGASLRFISLDGESPIGGFCVLAQDFLRRNTCLHRQTPQSIPHSLQTRSRGKGCASAVGKNNDFTAGKGRFDSKPSSEHNCMYVNPVEG